MNEECPICLEPQKEKADELLFQCQHTVCSTCSVELFKHQCMTSCPVCRADPKASNQFKVQIVCGERQIFYTDSGHYRVLDESSIRTGQVDEITGLLPELQGAIVVGVRFVDGSVAYLVHGPPCSGLLDLLAEVPNASHVGRSGRHARIQLSRHPNLYAELINGYALPAVEFVRLITFPVQLVEVEVPEEEQSESEEMSEEEGARDPMDTDYVEG